MVSQLAPKGCIIIPVKFLVVPAKAGTHASWQDWIPACAGMTEGGEQC
jgi:hypothetical protein